MIISIYPSLLSTVGCPGGDLEATRAPCQRLPSRRPDDAIEMNSAPRMIRWRIVIQRMIWAGTTTLR